MFRAIGTVLFGIILTAALPSAASAQSLTSCKKVSVTPTAQQAPLADGADPTAPRAWIAKGDPNGPFTYVTLVCDDVQLFADEVEFYQSLNLMKARGHVAFIQGTQRITADRMEFNTQTKLGTFWNAQGIMGIAGKASTQSTLLGASEADAYFEAEKIEIVEHNKFKLTNGRFTTCVQPTPRWEFEAADVVIVKDRRAVMQNAIFRIKNVPVFYLPWFYYPINKENRATGFLMPSYGNSTTRGQTIRTGFFWAINRSQDATLEFEHSSKAGQGYGGEYRYVQAPGSEGNAKVSLLTGSSEVGSLFPNRTFQVAAAVVQRLPANFEFRSNIDYTSNIYTQQISQQNYAAATSSTRTAAANLRGAFGRVLVDSEAGFTDIFYTATEGTRIGNAPRIGLTLAQAPLGQSKVYFGVTSEFAGLIRQDKLSDPTTKRNLVRFDINPIVRTPVGSLPYFHVTAIAGFRFTEWSQQLDPTTGLQVPISIHRNLLDLTAEIQGPTFSRIFDTPNSRYAKRWKHVIEPTFSISKTTTFKDFNLVPKNDGIDSIFGGNTSLSYGIANRLLAKRALQEGAPAAGIEVASITVKQTYYSNSLASTYDTSYQSALSCNGNSKFSPLSISLSAQPTTGVNVSANSEYSLAFHTICSTSVGAGVAAPLVSANVSWSKLAILSRSETGDITKTSSGHSISTATQFHTYDRRFSGTWSWSYDILRKQQLQQRYTAAYMAQCCGVAMEYQIYNYGGLSVSGLTQDKRFNISFSLAGIGTFTNLLGAFGR